MRACLVTWVVLLTLSIPRLASADVILFTSESSFKAAAGSLSFEGFEDTAPGQVGSSRHLDGFILGDLGGSGLLEIIHDPAVSAEGAQSAGGGTATLFYSFNVTPHAFGFTIFGFGDEGTNTLTLILRDLFFESLVSIPLASSNGPHPPFMFFGVISTTPFHAVELGHENPQDFTAVDAVHFGVPAAIPEPGTALLLGGGVAALMGRNGRRRRMRRSSHPAGG